MSNCISLPFPQEGKADMNVGCSDFRARSRMYTLTKKQVAELAGVSIRTIDYWRKSYGFPAIRIGQIIRFSEQETLEFIAKFKERSVDHAKLA